MIANQIDNQRALFMKLSQATTAAAEASGKDSEAYLRLEKRMLSASGSIQSLIAKQDKLKAQLQDINDSSFKSSVGITDFGDKAEKSSKKATSGIQKTLQMMEKMFIRIIAFRVFSAVTQGITDGINNMVQANKQANTTMSALATSSLYLKNSIAAALMPVIQALTPMITSLVDSLAGFFNTIGMLTARIFGNATTVTVAKKATVDYAASIAKAGDAAKEAQRSILGFDEITALTKPVDVKNSGIPEAKDMFETIKIPADTLAKADKIRKILKDLQPLFKGLGEVFSGFWNVIKGFAETYLYKWLVNIGNWMAEHPNTMYLLGKGLGYVAIGLLAFKGLKWLGEITGISKLVGWLWNLHSATRSVTKAFDEKNTSLDSQTAKTKVETKGLRNLVPWLLGATAAALGLGTAFGKLKMPSLNPGSDTSQRPASQPVPSPSFSPALAPAIIMTNFLASKAKYLLPIAAPAFLAAAAPAILLSDFLKSKLTYQSEVIAPDINQAVAPGIDLDSSFLPSIENAKAALLGFSVFATSTLSALGININSNVKTTIDNSNQTTNSGLESAKQAILQFVTAGSMAFSLYSTNVMTNIRTTAAYIPVALAAGLSASNEALSTWITSNANGFNTWGSGVVSIVGNAAQGIYQNFVSGLSAAWESFVGFAKATGKTILGGFVAAEYAAKKYGKYVPLAIGAAALIGITAGAAVPGIAAVAALAPIGLATGGLITGPTSAIIGEGRNDEAVLPLNPQVFASIGKGIRESGGISGGSGIDTERIIDRLDSLEQAISGMKVVLKTNDRTIAESANRGNVGIGRRYSPVKA